MIIFIHQYDWAVTCLSCNFTLPLELKIKEINASQYIPIQPNIYLGIIWDLGFGIKLHTSLSFNITLRSKAFVNFKQENDRSECRSEYSINLWCRKDFRKKILLFIGVKNSKEFVEILPFYTIFLHFINIKCFCLWFQFWNLKYFDKCVFHQNLLFIAYFCL